MGLLDETEEVASMRPRHKAAENRGARSGAPVGTARFNEAAA